jgi:Kef-type K+ transport system membrane component KefB
VQGVNDWLLCGVIIVVATAGKFGGTLLASRGVGLDWRHSATLGILMNTRGLVELIVLNIGLDLGMIAPRLFTMLVIMALVTTLMTSPILSTLNLREEPSRGTLARNPREEPS